MKLLAYLSTVVCAFGAASIDSNADVLSVWNSACLTAIRNESTSPPLAARNLAILHLAVFEAVNALSPEFDPYWVHPPTPSGVSVEAAAVGASYQTLMSLYPSEEALWFQTRQESLDALYPKAGLEAGFLFGEDVAMLILALRGADGSSTSVPYIPEDQPGDWRRTPPFFRPPELPQWPDVAPFAMTNGTQFRPQGPPHLTGADYAHDFNQVKALGAINSVERSPEQTTIARFWSDFSFTVTPPGHWNQIAQQLLSKTTNSLVGNARAFALLNIALADAGIAAWDAKYAYNFWRPVTAIREADRDGNPDTKADPDWTPLLVTPPFPEYVSGHSAFSAAGAAVLASVLGTDKVHLSVVSDAIPGLVRSYESLEAVLEEIGLSRIYGGIHFWSADRDGIATGRLVGAYVFENFLRPIPQPATVSIQALGDGMVVVVTGTPGQEYVLESGIDLRRWFPIQTNRSPFSYRPPDYSEIKGRFYRSFADH